MKSAIQNEFTLRVFDESYVRIEKCLNLLEHEEIWKKPNENIPAIGSLVLHCLGNARQWIISGLGDYADIRFRDWEFEQHFEFEAEDLLKRMEQLKEAMIPVVEAITTAKLKKKYTIQGFNVTGFSAMVHVIEHFSYHTGQISLMTKLIKNQDLGYYEGYNL